VADLVAALRDDDNRPGYGGYLSGEGEALFQGNSQSP
jgi:hypothetical protein